MWYIGNWPASDRWKLWMVVNFVEMLFPHWNIMKFKTTRLNMASVNAIFSVPDGHFSLNMHKVNTEWWEIDIQGWYQQVNINSIPICAYIFISFMVMQIHCCNYQWILYQYNHIVTNKLNSLRHRLNRRPFADDIFKCIFLNENEWISPRISLFHKFDRRQAIIWTNDG